jgi:hypothetical protein
MERSTVLESISTPAVIDEACHPVLDQPRLEMPAFEIILRLALQLLGNGFDDKAA